MNRRRVFFLALVIIFFFGLRCNSLTTRQIWYDDAFSIFLSQQPLADIVKGTAADTMPPLYYFILHFWMAVFGSSLASLRLLSIFFSLLTLLVFFDITRRLFGVEAGMWTAGLAAISPIQVYFAQEIRMYTLLELTEALYFWCFISLFDIPIKNRVRPVVWAGLILAGAASMYTHNLAVFGLIAADIYLLFHKRWKDLLRLLTAQLFIVIMVLPWLVVIPGQIEKIQRAFSIPKPGFVEIVQSVIFLFTYLPLKGFWMFAAAILSFDILIILTIEIVKSWRGYPEIRFLVFVAISIPGMLFALSYIMRPIFIPRGFLISALAFLGLAGWFIARPYRRGISAILAVTFIAAAAISLPSIYNFMEFPRSAFHETANYLRAINTDKALILHDNKLSFFPTHYYEPELKQEFLADEPGSPNDTYAAASQQAIGLIPKKDIETATTGFNHIYFVVFQQAIKEYQAQGRENHPILDWLESRYQLVGVKKFADLSIYEYKR